MFPRPWISGMDPRLIKSTKSALDKMKAWISHPEDDGFSEDPWKEFSEYNWKGLSEDYWKEYEEKEAERKEARKWISWTSPLPPLRTVRQRDRLVVEGEHFEVLVKILDVYSGG
ncbi:MAG: hypothetical protein Q9190_003810 [Brigantiaea leucoxantha]